MISDIVILLQFATVMPSPFMQYALVLCPDWADWSRIRFDANCTYINCIYIYFENEIYLHINSIIKIMISNNITFDNMQLLSVLELYHWNSLNHITPVSFIIYDWVVVLAGYIFWPIFCHHLTVEFILYSNLPLLHGILLMIWGLLTWPLSWKRYNIFGPIIDW